MWQVAWADVSYVEATILPAAGPGSNPKSGGHLLRVVLLLSARLPVSSLSPLSYQLKQIYFKNNCKQEQVCL